MAIVVATVPNPCKGRFDKFLACKKRAFKSKDVKGIKVKKQAQPNREYGSINDYERLERISSGAYGTVYRARHLITGEIVAVKHEMDGFSKSTPVEIDMLKTLNHPRIVEFKEVVVSDNDQGVHVVMEYLENDLDDYISGKAEPFALVEVKRLMRELLEGVRYLHQNRVMHRDLKPSNLLVTGEGQLKICDFGLARRFRTPRDPPYTNLVCTLWYRAPELLLGSRAYLATIDMWSVGCIMAELFLGEALFRGGTELQQLAIIKNILDRPRDELHNMFDDATESDSGPVLSESGFDLLCQLLAYEPQDRISARDALDHEWFSESC